MPSTASSHIPAVLRHSHLPHNNPRASVRTTASVHAPAAPHKAQLPFNPMKLASAAPRERASIHIQLPSLPVAPPEVSASVNLHSFCYICRSYVPASVHTASSAADYHKRLKDSDTSNHGPGLEALLGDGIAGGQSAAVHRLL